MATDPGVDRVTVPGCLAVDAFAGSGSVGVAVRAAGGGRRYLGVEIDARTAKVARSRLHGRRPG